MTAVLVAIGIVSSLDPARANNGLNFIGVGLESFAMGGADLAVSRDPLALSTNPAGLAWQRHLAVEQHIAVAHEIDVGFRDSLNPHQAVTNEWAPIANGGMTIPVSLGGFPITLSNGLFVQGGTGAAFKNVVTPFGTTDELSAKFGIAKASVGAAIALNERLSLGVGGGLYFARLDQKVFPGTSALNPLDPAHPFFGTYLRRATGLSGGVRLGLQYRVNDQTTLGAVYNNKVDLPLAGHHLIVNESAIGLGNVTYHDVRIKGLAEPQELGAGIAYRLTDRMLLAFDVKWLDWSGALKSSTLTASDPDSAGVPQTLSQTSSLNWRDQFVLALGAAFDLTPATILWAGYNYGRDPVPAATLNTLLGATGEHHLTVGIGWHPAEGWMIGTSLEFLVPVDEASTNPNQPLGSNVHVGNGYLAVHAGVRLDL